MRRDETRTAIQFALGTMLAACATTSRLNAAEALFEGFAIEEYATGLGSPTCLAFTPDGRLLVGDRDGTIHVVQQGLVRPTPFATETVHDFFESGLLNIAISPTFESDHLVYVFASISPEEQHIIRYRVENNRGVERTVIRDNLPSNGAFHNGGGMAFGPDGKLYFSIGDNGVRDNSQSLTTLAGKISRINPDGSTPADNPFTTPTGGPRATFAFGFRNVFRFCFDENGRLFATDVGSDGEQRREEINLVTRGGNYGWPLVEGFSDSTTSADGMTDPILAYTDEGSSPTAILSYSGAHFPAQYHGNLFMVEYARNRIYYLPLDGDRVQSLTPFVNADGGAVDMTEGPDGALYYCELVGGRVMRIRHGDDVDQLIPIGGIDFGDEEGGVDVDNSGESGTDELTPSETCATGLPFFFMLMTLTFLSLTRRRLITLRTEP